LASRSEAGVLGKIWKSWLIPGGLLLAVAVGLVNSSILARVAPSITFYYFAIFACGILLAWRFNSSRLLFSLLVLLLAERAVEFFSGGQTHSGPGHTAVVLVAVLVPMNFLALAAMRERGLTIAGIPPRFALLFVQSVLFAVVCRPGTGEAAASAPGVGPSGSVPLWTLLSFGAAAAVFVWRFFQTHKPIEAGFLWSLAAVFLWLYFGPIGAAADCYVATAGLILVASLIETSYVLAYHDELTGIPGRRAFNDALLSLDQNYAIAIVDIDHFKKFNDTYGHDVGDQVLRMIASRLAEVGGEGKAFRCGGEEFAIIFRDTAAKDAAEVLEQLRERIQNSAFRTRGSERRRALDAADAERRADNDRRKAATRKSRKIALTVVPESLSVTVSIGVAEPNTRYREPEQVIQAADQSLYRAKQAGRNRVEIASTTPLRLTRNKSAGASRH